MSKPKNRVMCPQCFRQKILFETKKHAENFIKFNGDEIDTHGGELRPYYCSACGGWHVSSKPYKKDYEQSTENIISKYRKACEQTGFTYIEGILGITKTILETLPKDVTSKSKMKAYLTSYFKDSQINKAAQEKVRAEIYRLIKSGKYSIRTKTVCDKILNDEEIIELLKEYEIKDTKELSRSIYKLIGKNHIMISKLQRKRVMALWYEKYIKPTIGTKIEKVENHKDNVEKAFQLLIDEIPQIDDSVAPNFIREMVSSFIRTNEKLPYLSAKGKNELKGLALKYYLKDKNKHEY